MLGKPLIQYSIDIAFQTSCVTKVFVSTDDKDIAEISKSLGAIVIKRPYELSQDNTPEWLAWKHAINWVNERYGKFNEFISLPATSPLRSVKDVKAAIKKRTDVGADICVAITSSNHSPFFNMVKFKGHNFVELVNKPIDTIARRQDAPVIFNITTVVYVANVDFIMKNKNIFDGNVTFIEVPKERSIDIDDINDFNFAELILKRSFKKDY